MSGSKGALLGAVILVVVAIIMGYIGMRDQKFNGVAQTTEGQIKNVVRTETLDTSRNSRHRTRVSYRVSFSYDVNGQNYNNTTSLSHDVPTGPTQVYYDPAKPDDGRLSKASPTLDFLVAIAMLIGAGVAAFKGLRG